MALWNNFPYSNVHELNLDWIIEKMKYLIDQWESYGTEVDADAVAGLSPQVTVEGDLKTGLTFHFTLVPGPEGPSGPTGNGIAMAVMDADYQLTLIFTNGDTWTSPSLKGDTGEGLEILDTYATLADLQTAHPTGSAGDAYLIGVSPSFTLYIWSTANAAWADVGALTSPSPSSTTPMMNGLAATGSELAYSRGDHVHPSDTAKQDKLVSGTNIRTINSQSLLGVGNITVQDVLVSGTDIKTINSEDLLGSGDISLQEPLVSGTNIKTVNSQSILGSGDLQISAGFAGIDVSNPIATSVNCKSGSPYTATQDCWVVAQTDRRSWVIDSVEIFSTGLQQKFIFPLKSGQSITTTSTNETLIDIYPLLF